MKKTLLIAALVFAAGSQAFAQNEGLKEYVKEKYGRPEVEEIVAVEETEVYADTIMAPGFTLQDRNGKDVSLSDFRGKWVVLDFWGSWCRWCIAGIPEMKKAYQEYSGRGLEIIGIDCRDTREVWKEAIDRYELPWVNLYNPDNSGLLEEYEIQGFPTKVIVSPEGAVYTIVIGEDPEFYEILKSLF